MPQDSGYFVNFGRERRFVRQLAQVFAVVGLFAIAAHRRAAPFTSPGASAVAAVSVAHLPFAPVALHPQD